MWALPSRLAHLRTRPDRHSSDADHVVVLSRELIAQNYLEIGRADGKAAILLATGGTLFGLLLVRRPLDVLWAVPLWWTAAVTTTGALVFLLLALAPRRGARAGERHGLLAYYEDVVRAETRADLSAGLRRDGSDPQPRLLRALRETSRIARAKNRCVRYAIVMLLPAITAAFLAVALGR
ncbi:Pycsar system effector family protein [Streptomyces sp. NPDC059355]|uniref:Pycsar system effector family protein n=1 Tax=Streptomyces sp. NPDC059355 TaxID=3346811 RepID=UPI00369BB024